MIPNGGTESSPIRSLRVINKIGPSFRFEDGSLCFMAMANCT